MVKEKEPEMAAEPEAEETALKQENEALARELKSREDAVSRLEQALAARDGEIAALQGAAEEAGRQLAGLTEALAEAVASYRDLVIQANPGVLAELITGDTVAAVSESLERARALVDRVRQEMEAEASKARVPAGAPPRAPLDISALTAREKIQYAIGGSPS